MRTSKRFGKGVGKLISSRDVGYSKQTILNVFVDKVIIKSDMFHSRVEDRIRTETCGTNIITINNRSVRKSDTELKKERANPSNFSSGGGHRPVLYFSRSASHCMLFLGAPGNRIMTEIDDVGTSRGEIIFITRPISVRKGMKC